MSQAITRDQPRDEKRAKRPVAKRRPAATPAAREALRERLRRKAAEADGGDWVSLSGLSDDEIVAALTSR